jgi:hypothetical protein
MSNFAAGLFPSWASFLTDKGVARQSDPEARAQVVVLPDRSQRPLYHVHQQIQASARPPPKAQGDEPERGPPGGRPRRRRHHNTTHLELRQ